MKKQITVTLVILTAVFVYALAKPSDTGGSVTSNKGASLHDVYKDMMQMVPFTFSRKEAPPAKPIS